MASKNLYAETAGDNSEDYSSEEEVTTKGKARAPKDPNKPVKRRSSKACKSRRTLVSLE